MKHLKTTLLAFALIFSANTLMAQEKYDYAVIKYNAPFKILDISMNGTSSESIKIPKNLTADAGFEVNPAITQVNKMEEDGWELFDTAVNYNPGAGSIYVFFMRRKEQ